jgi:hypothetical protein
MEQEERSTESRSQVFRSAGVSPALFHFVRVKEIAGETPALQNLIEVPSFCSENLSSWREGQRRGSPQ